MKILRLSLLTVFSLLFFEACVAYVPIRSPVVYRVSSYQVAWENSLKAAEDVGIRITRADQASGMIEGRAERTDVMIRVNQQPDERIRLEVSLRGPSREAYIADEFHRAYQRRAGRY
jgi:hypothetical protein